MEKRSIKEKSESQKDAAEASSAEHPEKRFKINLGIGTMLFCVLSLGIILAASGAITPQEERITSEAPQKNNYGFSKQTSLWINKAPVLTVEDPAESEPRTFNFDALQNWASSLTVGFPAEHPRVLAGPAGIAAYITGQSGATSPWSAFKARQPILVFDLDNESIFNFLAQSVEPQIKLSAQDAKLTIDNNKAVDFEPDVTGKDIDLAAIYKDLKLALFTNRGDMRAKIISVKPKITLKSTNALGINELVARGESNFKGSSASRIQNIRTGAARFNGVILAPQEEFSFNKLLGPVTAETGFKPELVIKSTGTVPELGGGLCQVSTTAFRAAFYGGLAITARKNHSYAVKYYSPQGTDATIYPGAVDFKFLNDTPAHLLISTRVDGTKLIFEFYGTRDGRKVSVDGPYQYDRKPDGSMKAKISRTVTLGASERTDNFYSKYVSKELYPTVYAYPSAQQANQNQTSPVAPEKTANPTNNPGGPAQ